MGKPTNNIPFTIEMLNKLSEFINSDTVEEKQWISDYEKQALKDAIFYLKRLERYKKEKEEEE